jgi:hypothetical protein
MTDQPRDQRPLYSPAPAWASETFTPFAERLQALLAEALAAGDVAAAAEVEKGYKPEEAQHDVLSMMTNLAAGAVTIAGTTIADRKSVPVLIGAMVALDDVGQRVKHVLLQELAHGQPAAG